ncbi:MAG: hypothetical protein KatS3mg027_1949 [Bacteroidia bacterium]|nr:MAG: hypothetical protein KatS3mg027_1949 [Bacteroidia bacterium]
MNEITNNTTSTIQKPHTEMKWYVLKAVSGQEKKIKSYIESELLA